ncbi:hypothetical protein BJ742DRAFT_848077 [Cladochytrium replicatum]|nr:hypothetical protein BJ742DRAFT_848077 [Cladochytrium replicatum]
MNFNPALLVGKHPSLYGGSPTGTLERRASGSAIERPTTTSPEPSEESADRIASLRNKLQAVSVKHVTKRASVTFSTSGSPTTASSSSSLSDSTMTVPSVETGKSVPGTPPPSAVSIESPERRASILEREPDPECACQKVLAGPESKNCKLCLGTLKPVVDLQAARDKLLSDLEKSRQKLMSSSKREDETIFEMSRLRGRVDELEEEVARRRRELENTQRDLQSMGEKLVDEIERRAELQASKEAVQDELEDLTKSLFEEANNLVATEARARDAHERREKSLEQQLEDTKHQLALERAQLKELRTRLEEQRHAEENDASTFDLSKRESVSSEAMSGGDPVEALLLSLQDSIDPLLLSGFESFLQLAQTIKLSKIHSIPFMKNALEDDVEPCLRFGGNPRSSTTKLIDSIVRNMCFVDELSPAQQFALERVLSGGTAGDIQIPVSPFEFQVKRDAVDALDPWGPRPPATWSLFSRTVIERFTKWGSGTSSTTSTVATPTPSASPNNVGANAGAVATNTSVLHCSTCGRLQGIPKYQLRASDLSDDIWVPICQHCRDRLVAACEFYNFVRHVRQGLYAARLVGELFVEVLSLKRKMFYARIGSANPAVFNERGWGRLKPLKPELGGTTVGKIVGRLGQGSGDDRSSVANDVTAADTAQATVVTATPQRQPTMVVSSPTGFLALTR